MRLGNRDCDITIQEKKGIDNRKRQCSQLSIVARKMLESIHKEDVAGILEIPNVIEQSQHGFVKAQSYLPKLLESSEEVTSNMDTWYLVDV
eukprot:g36128.t1